MAEDSKSEFGIYLLVGLVGLGINNLAIFVAFGKLGIALIWAKAIAAAMTFAFNFVVRKLVLF
jgi:putative flippase GtrA